MQNSYYSTHWRMSDCESLHTNVRSQFNISINKLCIFHQYEVYHTVVHMMGNVTALMSVACPRLSVSGDMMKNAARHQAGSGRERGDPARHPPSLFSLPDPARHPAAFLIVSPLTKSLEQAMISVPCSPRVES